MKERKTKKPRTIHLNNIYEELNDYIDKLQRCIILFYIIKNIFYKPKTLASPYIKLTIVYIFTKLMYLYLFEISYNIFNNYNCGIQSNAFASELHTADEVYQKSVELNFNNGEIEFIGSLEDLTTDEQVQINFKEGDVV